MIETFTLGQIRLAQAGETLTGFVSQKAEVLFIYLACHPHPHQRDALATIFWSDTTDEQAMKNLRTALASLSKQVGDCLLVDRQSIAVDPEQTVWLDVRALEAELNDFSQYESQRRKPPRSALKRLAESLDLYKGDFLPGFFPDNARELETWVTLERDRLRRLVMDGLGRLADQLTAWGEYQGALTHTYRLLKLDPLNEAGQRRLMRLLTYTGDRSEALRQFQTFSKALQAELEVEPEIETLALVEQIKTGRLRPAMTAKAEYHVPGFGSAFVERPYEMAQITERLRAPDCHLITMAGIGGAGKTHLALQAAQAQRDEFQHGIYFVPLAPVTEPDMVAGNIAGALPMHDKKTTKRQDLLDYLHDKHLLLILDNFEHLLDAAELVGEIVHHAPDIKLLVTSREPLRLRDEYVVQVEGLSLPPLNDDGTVGDEGGDTGAEYFDSVRLFNMVAARVQPQFQLHDHLDSVARICHLVAGLPLGIEIAAAHVPMMTPSQIESRLHSLTNVHRDVPQRHRGIGALLEDIWRVLTPEESHVLCRLTVFAGSFDLAAAMAITGSSTEVILSLVNKSLIQVRGERYLLHLMLRQFLQEKLSDSGVDEQTQAQLAHANYYRNWLDELETRRVPKHVINAALNEEYPNLWAAAQVGDVNSRLDMLAGIGAYWLVRGYHIEEAIALLRELLSQPDVGQKQRVMALQRLGALLHNRSENDEARKTLEACLEAGSHLFPRTHALTLNALAQVCVQLGEYEEARDYAEEIGTIYENAEDKDDPEMRLTHLLSRSILGYVHLEIGDYEQAQTYFLGAADMARDLNEIRDLTSILNNLGLIALKWDHFEQAYQHYSEALTLAYEIDHQLYVTILSNNLASAACSLDRYGEAYLLTMETIEMAQKIGYKLVLVYALDNFVTIAKGNKRFEAAATILGATDRLRQDINSPVVARDRDYYVERRDAFVVGLGQTGFDMAYQAGWQMSVNDAASYAQHHLYDV